VSDPRRTRARERLADLVRPPSTAILTMEMQRGVCGDLASIRLLAEALDESGAVDTTAALLARAREHDVTVVHCTFTMLADRSGTPMNTHIMRNLARDPHYLLDGGPAAEILPSLGRAPGDLISNRHHGFSPFTGTDLDGLLRSRGIETVVTTGVSTNLGIPGTVIEAVNLGYRVIVARDCLAGVPPAYADAVIDNTLAVVATIATARDIVACWG